MIKLTKMTPILSAGAAAAAIAASPVAAAQPPAPGCLNPDGTPCTPTAGAAVPGGPGAQAAADGNVSAGVPGGPWAVAGPDGGVACVPGGPCRTIDLPG